MVQRRCSDILTATGKDIPILGFGGDDRHDGGLGSDILVGGRGGDQLRGDGGLSVTEDPATQTGGNDILLGGAGDDTLLGEGGDDTLIGATGADNLQGGFGRDLLIGGPGADRLAFGIVVGYDVSTSGAFVAASVDTGLGPDADIILDFTRGQDLIDLSVINFFGRRFSSDIAFTFLGTDAFTASGRPELRYEIQGGHTVIQMDGTMRRNPDNIPADGEPDAEIILVGIHHLEAQDFIL